MKSIHFSGDHLLVPAVILSAVIHGLIIMATGWMPSALGVSVVNAPSSLEVTVISQPIVSVIEEEIVTHEIVERESFQEIAFSVPAKEAIAGSNIDPGMNSQRSQGAITKAKPLAQANLAPPYPWIARQRGWEGTVRLDVLIEEDGTPNQIGVAESSGHDVLDRAAVKTVKKWKFSPARSGPLQISSRMTIPIQFTLIREK